MMKKSIGAKVFKTILAVALMFGILIGMVAVGQLLIQKKNIDEINKTYEKELTGEAETQLNRLNREVAGNLTDLYGRIVNENFVSVRTLGQSVANYVGSLYSAGKKPVRK